MHMLLFRHHEVIMATIDVQMLRNPDEVRLLPDNLHPITFAELRKRVVLVRTQTKTKTSRTNILSSNNDSNEQNEKKKQLKLE